MLRLWHELHEMKPERDRRGSNHSFLPSVTWAGLVTLWGTMGCTGSCAPALPMDSRAAAETMPRKNRAAGREEGDWLCIGDSTSCSANVQSAARPSTRGALRAAQQVFAVRVILREDPG